MLIQNGTFPGEQHLEQCFDNLQLTIRAVLQTLPTTAQLASGPFGVFSTTCSAHCTTGGADFWAIDVNGVSFASEVTAWWFGGHSPKTVSDCIGYECMDACVPEEEDFPQGFGATDALVTIGRH